MPQEGRLQNKVLKIIHVNSNVSNLQVHISSALQIETALKLSTTTMRLSSDSSFKIVTTKSHSKKDIHKIFIQKKRMSTEGYM